MTGEDIFGKIDALLERRAGFGAVDPRRESLEDFPLLTEVVETCSQEDLPLHPLRGERRSGSDWLHGGQPGQAAAGAGDGHPRLSDEQLEWLVSRLERKLEDLFIRQQLRLEEAIRQALREMQAPDRTDRTDPL